MAAVRQGEEREEEVYQEQEEEEEGKEMRQPTLGCAAHKLRSFLFTERRPTPTENVARVRRGVC